MTIPGPVITVLPDGVRITADAGRPIMEALHRAGYACRTGCRRGGCGICKVDVLDGEVDHPWAVADTVLDAAERGAGTGLSCRAVPRGDVTVALRGERLRAVNPFLNRTRAAG